MILVSEHHTRKRRELRVGHGPRYFEKAEIIFVIVLVAFIIYAASMNVSVLPQESQQTWRWSTLRMFFMIIGAVIAMLAVSSFVLSALHLANVIKKKMHAPLYPPLLLIILNAGIIVAITMIMIEKLKIEL